jgi:hypothetical protein
MNEIDDIEETDGEISPVEWSEFDKKFSSIRRMDRDEILILCTDLIARLHSRTCCNRFIERDGDRTRVSYARTLVASIQAYGSLLKDEELESLKSRIDALEHAKGGSNQ